jgi:hypothetical protein
VERSILDGGKAADLFDGNPASLIRTENANPAVIVVEFPHPRAMRGFRLTTGSMDFELKASVSGPDGTQDWTWNYQDLQPDPTVEVDFPQRRVDRVRLEIRDIHITEPAKIHVRELKFL